jgi:hypothetical protein
MQSIFETAPKHQQPAMYSYIKYRHEQRIIAFTKFRISEDVLSQKLVHIHDTWYSLGNSN